MLNNDLLLAPLCIYNFFLLPLVEVAMDVKLLFKKAFIFWCISSSEFDDELDHEEIINIRIKTGFDCL